MADLNFGTSSLNWKGWLRAAHDQLTWVVGLQLGLGVIGLASSGLGGWYYLQAMNQPSCFLADTESLAHQVTQSETQTSPPDSPAQITVYVSGAVQEPGLVQVPDQARVAQAIDQAGGLTDEADLTYVAQQLNLASKLNDSDVVFVPLAGQAEIGSGLTSANNPIFTSGLISINTASQKQLEELPMIGPKRAEDIVGGRPYSSIDELLVKKVVTETLFSEIEDKISL